MKVSEAVNLSLYIISWASFSFAGYYIGNIGVAALITGVYALVTSLAWAKETSRSEKQSNAV